MLEKIGLPAKPSMRGNNWVVDASHCQGCSSQFTFINRKHHCRRCGGIFCNSCTHQRMVLRGQGDSPVRICEPCKQLEEAARFELRYGNKTRASRGSSKMTSKNEDEILNQILGNDAISRGTSSSCASSCSTTRQVSGLDSLDDTNLVQNEIAGLSISPEELRKQAVHEKKKYKVLKEEGKSDEAMKAFKRGKELERQADALEISIRKNRRKVLTSGNVAQTQSKDGSRGSRGKSKEKDDLTAELRELGWTDTDPHDVDKRSVGMSLEGELSSLLGDTSQRGNKVVGTSGIDKTQVVAHKRKALTLKREGKLSEAKEELKKAKLLEKQLEEQELMSGVEDSDDEISALIRSMDDDKQDDLLVGYEHDHGFDFDHLIGIADNLGDDRNLEVTGEDLMDPEIAATLKSLGWTDDHDDQQNNVSQSIPIDREVLLSEIHALKTEALNQKRAGNVAEAMAQLKQAKLLERDLESLEGVNDNLKTQNTPIIRKGSISQNIPEMKNKGSKVAPKNRLMIQKELLALKKKALTLRREGRLDEAEGELKKGRVLEQQLEDMDNASKAKAAQVTFDSKDLSLVVENSHIHENVPIVEAEEDVTEEDMHDPEYISYLRNLGWKEDNEYAKGSTENGNNSVEISEPSVHTTGNISSRSSRRSKGEIQRELLALKRKALALRREGKADEADGVLSFAKTLETLMAETEASFKKEIQVDSNRSKDGDNEFEDKNNGTVSAPLKPFKEYDNHSLHITETSITILSSNNSSMTLRSKGEIQRELLGLKRKALALRREGKTDEAEEVLSSAKALETKMLEMEASKEIEVESNRANDEIPRAPLASAAVEGDADDVIEKDMYESYDPALHSMLKNLKDEEFQPVNAKGKVSKDFSASSVHSSLPSASPSSCSISAVTPSGKGEARQDDVGGEVEPLDKIGSLKNVGIKQGIDFIPPPSQSGNIMDLLTGDGKKDFQIPSSKLEDIVNSDFIVSSLPEAHVQVEALPSSGNLRSKKDRVSFGSDSSCQAQVHAHVESLTSSSENLRSMVHVTTEKREEIVAANEKPRTYETISQGLASQNNQSSTRQEVLARKRNAVALKREGKLLEAREELRQAKLLEKSLEAETTEIKPDTRNVSTSLATAPPVQQKEFGTSNLATKQLSGRDRFKLQQESLSHKRQALKLRREGRMEEAEAEFEVAKALEMQLEEMASQSSAKSSAGRAEPVDDVMVEDLLDPQLLSALRAIGIEDANVAPKGPEIPGPLKVIPGKGENFIQERIQLEEQIKAEKVKAVTLKRSGKQAEALEALRQAKLFEKKLSSLASS